MPWSRRREDLERILEQLPIGFSYLDLDRRVVRMNALLLGWMGMTAEHAAGRHCYELVAEMRGEDPETATPCSFCGVPRAIETDEPVTFVNEISPDFVLQNTTVPIEGDSGEIVGTVELLEDITARRQAQELLRRTNEELERRVRERTAELEELNRLKDLFVDILRHDLTNPLQVVSICHRHLRDEGAVSSSAQRYLDGLEDASQRAMKVVTDAATYGRLETTERIHAEPVDLLAVIQQAVHDATLLSASSVERVRVTSLGAYPISGDPGLIELVFTNLLSNALQYSPDGSRVEVEIVDGGDQWCARVMDRGAGIAEAHKNTVFERFVRGDRGGVKGTGLGLAIVRRVMNLHRGDVWVEDNPAGGSVFVACFPKRETA